MPHREQSRPMITGQELHMLRQAMGLTTRELAQLLGCAWGTIRNIEAQDDKPITPTLTLLVTLLLDEGIRRQIPTLITQRQTLLRERREMKSHARKEVAL